MLRVERWVELRVVSSVVGYDPSRAAVNDVWERVSIYAQMADISCMETG